MQFGLRHLFGLTTLAALAAALAVAFGPKTLVASAGIFLAWLNLCGAFHVVQQGRAQTALLWLAWTTFLISLALPSMRVFGPVFGWSAAWFAITAPLNAIQNDPFQPGIPLFFAIDVANLLAVLLPLLIWQISRGHGRSMSVALCLTMVSTWVVWEPTMLVGYYVWCLSFFLAVAAMPLNRRMFAGMTALAIFFVAVAAKT